MPEKKQISSARRIEHSPWIPKGRNDLLRQELVRQAIALIKPKEEARDECQYEITLSDAAIDMALLDDRFATAPKRKQAKKAVRRLASALRRVEIALLGVVNFDLRIPMPIDDDLIRNWREDVELIAKTPSGKLTRESAERKRLAVAEAHRLLEKYGAAITPTRGSNFCRLAALLYGDPRANLRNQCRAHRRSPRHPILEAFQNCPYG
jgi:hypothetical protein